VTSGLDGKIIIWDIITKEIVNTIQDEAAITSVSLSNGGRYVVAGRIDGDVNLYDVHTGDIVRRFKGHDKMVSSVALSMCV